MTSKPPERLRLDRLATPIGESLIVTDEVGYLRAFDWTDRESRMARLLRLHYGSIVQEPGVSKAGNPRLRKMMVQLAWLWLRHQPQSALARWFNERTCKGGGRKTAIVALARKLLVALWKYVSSGVVIEGAVMKAAA